MTLRTRPASDCFVICMFTLSMTTDFVEPRSRISARAMANRLDYDTTQRYRLTFISYICFYCKQFDFIFLFKL